MRKNKRMVSMMLVAFLCCFMAKPTYALTPISSEGSSLTVEYEYDGMVYEDVEVSIYYVASWEDNNFILTKTFEDSGVVLEATTTPSASEWKEMGETLEEYIHDIDCECEDCQHTDSYGISTFDNLSDGVYYVEFEDVVCEDGTLISDPVVVTLPSYDGITNTWDYDLVVDLKVALIELDEPEDPGDPTTPNKPSRIKRTSNSEDPEEPEDPETPEEPDEPDKPEEPEEPVEILIEEGAIPQTGSMSWLVTPLAFAGIVLFFLGLLGLKRKGRDDDA